MTSQPVIRTPDQRLRVFVSSTLGELSPERAAVREAIERLHLAPVMFELGARPHPPRELYRAYLAQSHIFIGIYWQRYGWVAPGEEVSGLEDEYRLVGERPRLLYIKGPAPEREPRLAELLREFQEGDQASYKRFETPEELARLVADDLAVLLSERFEATAARGESRERGLSTAPPLPLTETVGRTEAIAQVVELLASGVRLLTLTGPGGIGKSRLALEVARAAGDAFPGGVHFVALASVSDPALVLRTVADRLGARTEGSRNVGEAIAEHLGDRPVLLLLDNLEQVVEAGPDVAALLERAPQLHVLATSRQALRVRGEQEVPVTALPLPEGRASLEALRGEPAVRLFVERARAVSPGFELTAESATAVAEICRRLDGLPLAIELAAARVRLLSPSALLARLADRFDVLAQGATDAPERQRTLRSTIDWSYELLDEAERALFARLSVFVGGCTLEAAEAVCAGAPVEDVMETLASLLDKSLLVVADEATGGEPRFRMLETVRAYARERLQASGDSEEYRRRHLEWFAQLSDQAQPYLCGPGQREWAALFDPERANIRAAMATALDRDEDATAIEMMWDLFIYYEIRDALEEPHAWVQELVARRRPLDEATSAKLRSALGIAYNQRGEFESAREHLLWSLDRFRAHGMDFESAVTLMQLGFVVYAVDGDMEGATALLDEASRLFSSVAHDWGVAACEATLGMIAALLGEDLPGAEAHERAALECARAIGNEPLTGRALTHLGMIALLSGQMDTALGYLREAAEVLRGGRYQAEGVLCLFVLGDAARTAGNPGLGARALLAAEAVRARIGTPEWPYAVGLLETLRSELGPEGIDSLTAESHEGELFAMIEETHAAVSALGRGPEPVPAR